MAVSSQDRRNANLAVQIRPRFQPHLQDIAEGAVAVLAESIGPQVKHLYPETRMSDVVQWLKSPPANRSASLDWIEILMAVDERVSSEVEDDFAEALERHTFGEYLEHLHARRRGV